MCKILGVFSGMIALCSFKWIIIVLLVNDLSPECFNKLIYPAITFLVGVTLFNFFKERYISGYKLRILQIRMIKKCIKSVEKGNWENEEDREFTLCNYNNVLKRLKLEKGLFTKVY